MIQGLPKPISLGSGAITATSGITVSQGATFTLSFPANRVISSLD
jgi:hypothetical protein